MTTNPLHKNQAGQPAVNGGHFASKTHAEGDIALAAEPVTVYVRLQRWDGDYATELETIEFDGRTILDSMAADDVDQNSDDYDDIYFTAQRLGIAKEHEGPFSVDLYDPTVTKYLDARNEAGLVEPLTGEPRRTRDQLNEARRAITAEREALDMKTYRLAKEAVETVVLEEHPDAKEIELEDIDDDFGNGFQLRAIRDADGVSIWDVNSDEPHEADGYAGPLGFNSEDLAQAPNEKRPNGWYGIIVR